MDHFGSLRDKATTIIKQVTGIDQEEEYINPNDNCPAVVFPAAQVYKVQSQAEIFSEYVKSKHTMPNLYDLDIFAAFKVDEFVVRWNSQGFYMVSEVWFKDGSIYERGGNVDHTFYGKRVGA